MKIVEELKESKDVGRSEGQVIVDHSNTICSICHNSKTFIKQNGRPMWHKYTDGTYICHSCNTKVHRNDKINNPDTDHTNTSCCLCSSKETWIYPNGRPRWLKYKLDKDGRYNENGVWNNNYICQSCYDKNKSSRLKERASAKFRNKQLSKDSASGKGFIGQQIFCKVRGVKDCNVEMDNFEYKYDHSPDPEYGLVNTKTATLSDTTARNHIYEIWQIHTDGEYDYIACICFSKDRKNVERVYIIPKKEIGNIKTIAILKSSTSKWEKYKVDEKPYNEAYHTMSLKNCPVLSED